MLTCLRITLGSGCWRHLAPQSHEFDRGPSAKLKVPYYRTDIHLHGGSSGGPVFNFDGGVFDRGKLGSDNRTSRR
jgi:hypothetical protein